MADPTLRSLERALAAGDQAARVPLAAAWLRQGRAAEVIDLLEGEGTLPPEAAALHEEAWRRELARLEPALDGGGLGDATPDDVLVGWFGGGRYAAVGGPRRLRVVDLERGAAVPPGALPLAATPVATSRDFLFCRAAGEVLQVIPPRADHEPWQWSPVGMVGQEPSFEAAPDGRRALVRLPDGMALIAAWPDGDLVRSFPAPCDVRWSDDRVAWWKQGRVIVAPVAHGGAPPQVIDVTREVLSRAPLLAGALPTGPTGPRLFQFLSDGRLLLGPPLVVLDLQTSGYAAPVEGRDPALEGPARLSSDGAAVLAFRGAFPVRIPLEGSAPERRPRRDPPGVAPGARAWHPRADVAATGPLDRGQPELRGAEGETVRALPRDVRPLGWTPDGRGLLVHRVRGPGGSLELWRVPSAAALRVGGAA